jgi:hypothetical protein
MSEKKEEAPDARDAQAKALGAIKCIECEGKRLYLKMPHRNIIGIAFAQRQVNMVQACETIARGSAIKEVSDMVVFENDQLFLSIMADITDFMGDIELKKSTSRTL